MYFCKLLYKYLNKFKKKMKVVFNKISTYISKVTKLQTTKLKHIIVKGNIK